MTAFSPRRIVILGAGSAIAVAVARLYAAAGPEFVLMGRRADALSEVAADLTARGARAAHVEAFDLADAKACEAVLARAASTLGGGIDLILLAYGVLGDQASAETDLATAEQLLTTNFQSAALWCLAAGKLFQAQRQGRLAVIGSVAGDRGRKSNYIYGATKAGLATLVTGMAHRFAGSDIHFTLIKPGFVDTPMTAAIPRKGALWAKPDQVAEGIRKAVERRAPVAYVPGFWRFIMLMIRLLPWTVFSRLKL